jgi:ElaB/YqjD/DUF883 family membrane-anchored ribosome-binding protein
MADRDTATDAPTDVGEAKREIERNRERISETLDAIEYRIVDTREQIRDRLDVARPLKDQVRRRPWAALGVAAGVGVVLGILAGGRSGRDGYDIPDAHQRRELREWRRQRRNRLGGALHRHDHHDHSHDHDHLWEGPRRRGRARSGGATGTRMKSIRRQLLAAVGTAVLQGLRDRVLHGTESDR